MVRHLFRSETEDSDFRFDAPCCCWDTKVCLICLFQDGVPIETRPVPKQVSSLDFLDLIPGQAYAVTIQSQSGKLTNSNTVSGRAGKTAVELSRCRSTSDLSSHRSFPSCSSSSCHRPAGRQRTHHPQPHRQLGASGRSVRRFQPAAAGRSWKHSEKSVGGGGQSERTAGGSDLGEVVSGEGGDTQWGRSIAGFRHSRRTNP